MGGNQRVVPLLGWLALLSLVSQASAGAQPAQPSGADVLYRPFVGVSVLSSTSPPGPDDYHYVPPMIGGTVPAVAITGGIFVVPRLSVGGEVNVGGSLSGVQTFAHSLYHRALVSHRETILAMIVRGHLTAGRADLQPLFGIGVVRGNTSFTGNLYGSLSRYPRSAPVPGPDEFYTSNRSGFLVGADVAGAVTRRFALTSSFRFLVVSDRYDMSAEGFTGIGNTTFQFGGGVRWTFARR